ncbi:MAG: hypothetical protein QXK80_02730 [Candidatus Pacearchaeota archaeon]
MANGKTYNRPRTVKLDETEDLQLQKHCGKLGIDVSTFIRKAINEKINFGHVSNIAGQNIIEFDSKEDKFLWKIKLDNGEEKTILEDLSPEFMQDLFNKIQLKLKERDDLLQRKNKKSVPVPRRLMR